MLHWFKVILNIVQVQCLIRHVVFKLLVMRWKAVKNIVASVNYPPQLSTCLNGNNEAGFCKLDAA